MESTSYERIVLVIASYIIGATTAYIALTFTISEPPKQVLVTANLPTRVVADEKDIRIDDQGLFFVSNGEDRILSINQAAVGLAGLEVEPTNGFHYRIVDAVLSPNRQFVYFCEQLASDDDICEPLVYDSETDIVHGVSTENIYVTEHEAAWSDQNELILKNFTSSQNEEPWQ